MLGHNFATATFSPDVEGWTCTYQKGGSQCGRFGTTTANNVVVESPSFELNGTATLAFKCAPLGKENFALELSSDNADLINTHVDMPSGKWTDFSTIIKANGSVKLTFTSSHAFFLDEVNVTASSTGINSQEIKSFQNAPYTYIYNMQGQEVYKSKTQDFCLDDVPAHGVLIVKQGDTTRKVVK